MARQIIITVMLHIVLVSNWFSAWSVKNIHTVTIYSILACVAFGAGLRKPSFCASYDVVFIDFQAHPDEKLWGK